MLIETTRFGALDVDENKFVTFQEGLLGFPGRRRFALIQASPDPVFFWMQCVEDPHLAFVVCDPRTFVADYEVSIRKDDVQSLGLRDLSESQVLVIVNKVDGDLTANLLGPIVIGAHSLRAKQLVLSDKRYGTRHRLLSMEQGQAVAQTA